MPERERWSALETLTTQSAHDLAMLGSPSMDSDAKADEATQQEGRSEIVHCRSFRPINPLQYGMFRQSVGICRAHCQHASDRIGNRMALPATQKLTEKQASFVQAVLNGSDEKAAMGSAGYAESVHPCVVLASEAVQEALRDGRKRQLTGEMGTLALNTMRDLLKPGQPASTRYNAAKWVLEHGEQAADEAQGKPLSQMSEAELLATLEKAQTVIDAAKIIDVTPKNGA